MRSCIILFTKDQALSDGGEKNRAVPRDAPRRRSPKARCFCADRYEIPGLWFLQPEKLGFI